MIVLSRALPNSWSSVNSLREKYYAEVLGTSNESVTTYIENNEDKLRDQLTMLKKIITTLKDHKLFSENQKERGSYYQHYRSIICRFMFYFNDMGMATFRRHAGEIIKPLREQVLCEDIQTQLACTSRNAEFQKKLIHRIDQIIHNTYEATASKRLFSQQDKEGKLQEQGNKCNHCRLEKEEYEGDHIIPWSEGGKTEYDNLQLLCRPCHVIKSSL
jgi:5-methylcytosine-specific restriction endonuclease McrA